MTAKPKTVPACVLCGSPTALECGFIRCTSPACRHTQQQDYAFQQRPAREPRPRWPAYERETAKPVDEEFV